MKRAPCGSLDFSMPSWFAASSSCTEQLRVSSRESLMSTMIMSLSTSKLGGASQHLVIGENISHKRLTARRLKPFQVKCNGDLKPSSPKNVAISRRDTVLGLAIASLTGFVLPTEAAEARVVKPEIRRKIREKLEMERKKAGVSKPKSKEQPSPPSSSSKKENDQLSLELPSLPFSSFPYSDDRSLVETGL